MLTKTKVTMFDGSKLTFKAALTRTLWRITPFDTLSYMFGYSMLGTHDVASGTKVVNAKIAE